jgi:HrpA-like RNA helicase
MYSSFRARSKFVIVPLHGSISPDAQRQIFRRPPRGVRKIVVSTNVAETSITIDDSTFYLHQHALILAPNMFACYCHVDA